MDKILAAATTLLAILANAKPAQYFMWGGWVLILVSALSGFGGVAVVDEMRRPLIILGSVMAFYGSGLAIYRAIVEDRKAQPPACNHDDSEPPAA